MQNSPKNLLITLTAGGHFPNIPPIMYLIREKGAAGGKDFQPEHPSHNYHLQLFPNSFRRFPNLHRIALSYDGNLCQRCVDVPHLIRS